MSDQTPPRTSIARNTSASALANDNNLAWFDMCFLGFTPMDDVYERLRTLAPKLVTYPDTSAADAIERLEWRAISYFEQEDERIRSISFPPWDCYLAGHTAVLESVGDVRQVVALEEVGADVVRNLGMALFDWFPIHANYLNSALAVWMTKQTMGGKSIVLRRTLA